MRSLVVLPFVAALAACNGDGDGDGLAAADEKYWGTDPKVADSDGDGVVDGDEVTSYGTHPAYADSDGDGGSDGDELTYGLDPLDPDSHFYTGGWPMLLPDEKDTLEASNRPFTSSGVGQGFKRFSLVDQFGDMVDIYDFALAGKPIIVDVSAEWCGPCNQMAAWLDGEGESFNGLGPSVRDAVNNGDVIWITVLGQDNSGADATSRTVKSWFREYKNPNVPVLAAGEKFVEYVDVPYWPVLFTLDEDMVMTSFGDEAYTAIVDLVP